MIDKYPQQRTSEWNIIKSWESLVYLNMYYY